MAAKNYLFRGFLLGFGWMASGCVTEPKLEHKLEDAKPFIATVSPEVAVKATTPPEHGDAVPGGIVIKCRVKYDREPSKNLVCGPTTVKITNELSKSSKNYSFKGDRVVIPVTREASYIVEVKTKGCDEPRAFMGMTMGMTLSAQFENCGGTR